MCFNWLKVKCFQSHWFGFQIDTQNLTQPATPYIAVSWSALEKLLCFEEGSLIPSEEGLKDAEWAALCLDIPGLMKRVVGRRCKLDPSSESNLVSKVQPVQPEDGKLALSS